MAHAEQPTPAEGAGKGPGEVALQPSCALSAESPKSLEHVEKKDVQRVEKKDEIGDEKAAQSESRDWEKGDEGGMVDMSGTSNMTGMCTSGVNGMSGMRMNGMNGMSGIGRQESRRRDVWKCHHEGRHDGQGQEEARAE